MNNSDLWIYILSASVAANGFFANYVLLSIKSQLKGMRNDITQLKDDQNEQGEVLAVNNFRLQVVEKDLEKLPCQQNIDCKNYGN